MPPTRGHDLKLIDSLIAAIMPGMPPTRGHDLKPGHLRFDAGHLQDAPHTGARLETRGMIHDELENLRCPPHGGTT